MKSELLSVGIDIGTSTSQLIFSRLLLENVATTSVPEVRILSKTVIYKSKIYRTPLTAEGFIDVHALKAFIAAEYRQAKINKEAIATGAIILTGETSRKGNAQQALHALADFAGDFVVAAAGPDLEAILAGCGAGAKHISGKNTGNVMNFDIGGGTTNAAIFYDGNVIDVFALDIGGRTVKFDKEGNITYISNRLSSFLAELGLHLQIGNKAILSELKKLTDAMARILSCLIKGGKLSLAGDSLFINHTCQGILADSYMFSGGVAEFIYSDYIIETLDDVMLYGDIGPLLGVSIREALGTKALLPNEKIRATVIGAGSHSVKLSGSTVCFAEEALPLKNISVVKLNECEMSAMAKNIKRKANYYGNVPLAVAFSGSNAPTYSEIKKIATEIVEGMVGNSHLVIVIVEHDFAKALGLVLRNLLSKQKPVICLDQISVEDGDYIDIGKPAAEVVPVVIKTLIFKS